MPPIARLCLAAALVALAAAPAAAAAPRIAIADIGFTNSSGEARDQSVEHEARRKALTAGLRTDIDAKGPVESVGLTCEGPCPLDASGVEALRQRAREAGAAFVLVGSVHKMSTLVMSMRVAVLDVATGKLVLERLLSFRGDNDDGWRHAGDFVAREVTDKLDGAAAPK